MNTIIRNIVARTYKPLLQKYLSRTRVYRYGNIRLEIPPAVFHPGFFFSTTLLMQYCRSLSLNGKKFLELGAGSGLLSIYAAKKGAKVMATDINPVAICWLNKNSRVNNTTIDIIHSDLFEKIPYQIFDIIMINPPYYKKQPTTWIEHAWFCGMNGEYFYRLFSQLNAYINDHSEIIMVLCDGCDIEMIMNAAAENHFSLHCIETKQNLLEKNFIYKIQRMQ